MKLLKREFTWREKMLLLLLALILLGGVYYYAVDRPVRSEMSQTQKKLNGLNKELAALKKTKKSLTNMQKELDYLTDEGRLTAMGSYNNLNAELAELNDILELALKYDIVFTKSVREGNLIRKYFTISCTTIDYEDAEELITELNNFPYRCIISDIKVASEGKGADLLDGMIQVTVSAAFYETAYEEKTDPPKESNKESNKES